MHGNAWEWVQDWSALYEDVPQVGPKGPDEGTYRIVRGGVGAAWCDRIPPAREPACSHPVGVA